MKLLQKIKSFFYERKGHCQSIICSECNYYSNNDDKPCLWLNQLENKQEHLKEIENDKRRNN